MRNIENVSHDLDQFYSSMPKEEGRRQDDEEYEKIARESALRRLESDGDESYSGDMQLD